VSQPDSVDAGRPRAHQPPFFEIHDREFLAVLGAAPRLLHVVDTDAHEGPVYVSDEDALYFTTLPRFRRPGFPRVDVKRLQLDGERFPLELGRLSVTRKDANAANGMAMDHDRRLLVCEQGTLDQAARIARLDRHTGEVETVVDAFRELRLNSPNDVVVRSDGTIWFTDPGYGHLQGFRPDPEVGDYVYRYEPREDRLCVVADSFDKPNGLTFSPDETVLYVGDSGATQEPGSYHVGRPHHIQAFDVADGSHLINQRLFAVTMPGFPDGLKVDSAGRVYASSFSGVQVFNPAGDLIGEIGLPGAVNFTFGGRDLNVLFITADSAIWAAVLAATGSSGHAR
jgi:gluconolactonase